MRKRKILGIVIRSHFSYCPVVWMFRSKQTNSMINNLHERALRIVLNDQTSNFETLLTESIWNDHRNIKSIGKRRLKYKITLLLNNGNYAWTKTVPHNLKNPQEFVTQRNRTINYGLEFLSNRLLQLWPVAPDEYKQKKSLNQFKSNLKKWICSNCLCRICKRLT